MNWRPLFKFICFSILICSLLLARLCIKMKLPNDNLAIEEFNPNVHDPEGKVNSRNKKKKINCPGVSGLGILYAIICSGFFALSSVFVKLIQGVDGIQLALSRFAVQFLILLPLLTYERNEIDVLGPVGLRRVLWLRGFFGSITVPCVYLSVKRMDVGDAVTIGYTSMMMLPFLARLILKEKLTVFEIILALVSLGGVVLIARPAVIFPSSDMNPVDALGVTFALLGAAAQAISMTFIRKLGKTNAALNVLYFSIVGSFITFPTLVILQKLTYPCHKDLIWVFLLGIFGVIGQYFLTLSLRYERAATVGVARSAQVILAYVFQVLMLGEIPSMSSLAGSGLIFSSCVILAMKKVIQDRRKEGQK